MRLRPWLIVTLAVVLLGAAAGIVVVFTGGDGKEDPARAAVRDFLDDWAAGREKRAAARSDDPGAAADLLTSVDHGLHPRRARFTVGSADRKGADGPVIVRFTADLTLDRIGHWRYASRAVAEPKGEGWRVRWTPRLVHPRLGADETLVLTKQRARRAPVLAADGSPLAADGRVWTIGLWREQLSESRPEEAYDALRDPALGVHIDIKKLKKRVAAAGPNQSVPVVTVRDAVYQRVKRRMLDISGLQFRESRRPVAYHARSLVGAVTQGTDSGTSGLQARYDKQLHAPPAAAVVTADRETGQPVRTLVRKRAGKGTAVTTTIDPKVQKAAEAAVGKLKKNASLVTVQPGTGHVLAVADNPAEGPARGLSGRYPPGSTFKVVSAAALAAAGIRPSTPVRCPKHVTVAGQRFENQDEFDLPAGTTFGQAFAQSCNTAFIGLRDRIGADALTETAETFGIGGTWQVGAATFDGSVPPARGENEKAADLIGQGRVEASPLVMASVAATVKEGRFRQPVLVPKAVTKPHRAPAALDGKVAAELRSMMRKVVTEGSGRALEGLPGQPHAKTGTAEFGTASPPRTHAWMIGYLGGSDLAFSVLIEDGGSGGKDAGPVAADFLEALG